MSSELSANLVALNTIVYREVRRFTRIWPQTLLPPAITMVLYFVIFGNLIGRQIGDMGGFTYMEYIVPGLIMMSVITNAYGNVVSSFFGSKFQRSVEELLVSPVSPHTILLGYTIGGVLRGLAVGVIVTLLSLFFTKLQVHHLGITVLVVVLTATIFSLGGFINAVFARNFDDISIIPTFVLTPLTYLGGVFYSINLLPPFWQTVSLANPILHMVNAFRYGILGVSDIRIGVAIGFMLLATAVLYFGCVRLLVSGVRNSWAMSAENAERRWKASSRRASMAFSSPASPRSSSGIRLASRRVVRELAETRAATSRIRRSGARLAPVAQAPSSAVASADRLMVSQINWRMRCRKCW